MACDPNQSKRGVLKLTGEVHMLTNDQVDELCEQLATLVIQAAIASSGGQVKAVKNLMRQGIKLVRQLPVQVPENVVH